MSKIYFVPFQIVATNLNKIKTMIDNHSYLTIRKIAPTINISIIIVSSYLRQFGMNKKFNIWVSYQLSAKNLMY